MLSSRQEAILRLVVETYLDDGRPVGSKAIAERGGVQWSPSTIRSELAALEAEGFLTHPHTSAGRTPTDGGYRFYAERLLERPDTLPATTGGAEIELGRLRREVDEAMREATSALSRATDLAALATLPPVSTTTIHRVEALLLHPRSVMVIVITSAGGVVKRIVDFDSDLDHGLVEWAGSYLNERLTGMAVGARMLSSSLRDPELSPAEQRFLDLIAPVFSGLGDDIEGAVYVDGTARLLTTERAAELPHVDGLMRVLEERATLLGILGGALERRSVYMWIGDENPSPELRSVSIVGANYGLGHRNLGAVGVIGPLRMDYARAIASVREAATALSRYFESVYAD